MAKIKPTHAAVFIVVKVPYGRDTSWLDMLRYDNCVPGSDVEASRMSSVIEERPRPAPARAKTVAEFRTALDKVAEEISNPKAEWIVFKRFVPQPGGRCEPQVDRWASFGLTCSRQTFDNYEDALRAAVVEAEFAARKPAQSVIDDAMNH